MTEIAFSAENFSGVARLFPIPNLVMFPHVIQPLHIFEPRYRALLAEAMDDDRLIALPVLAPGWESDYEGTPKLEPVACLGKVVSHQEMKDGRSNILLVGLKRIRLVQEMTTDKSFRTAKVELIEDFLPANGKAGRKAVHDKLLSQFKAKLIRELDEMQCLEEMLRSDMPLSVLTDIVAHTLNLSTARKVRLLSETNVDRRAGMLIELLAKTAGLPRREPEATFPPQFSIN